MRVPCVPHSFSVFFNDTATTEIYTYFHTLSLHDALPICRGQHFFFDIGNGDSLAFFWFKGAPEAVPGISAPEALPTPGNFMSAHGRSEEHTSELQSLMRISYAVFCLQNKITLTREQHNTRETHTINRGVEENEEST